MVVRIKSDNGYKVLTGLDSAIIFQLVMPGSPSNPRALLLQLPLQANIYPPSCSLFCPIFSLFPLICFPTPSFPLLSYPTPLSSLSSPPFSSPFPSSSLPPFPPPTLLTACFAQKAIHKVRTEPKCLNPPVLLLLSSKPYLSQM